MAQNNNVPAVPKPFQLLLAIKNRSRVQAAGLERTCAAIWTIADEMKARDPDIPNEELLGEAIEYVMLRLWYEQEVLPQLKRAFERAESTIKG